MTMPEHMPSVCTMDIITKFLWQYSCTEPKVLTSYHQIFICLVFWRSLRGNNFSDDAAVHNVVYQWLQRGGEQILVSGNAYCCSRTEEDYWQSWRQYLKLTKP